MSLIVVPTPIGNLGDITLRALEVLKSSDLILAEDTRVSAKLLKHYDVGTHMKSYHAHNEHHMVSYIIDLLQQNQTIALISDAGTPGISDPGFLLVREAVANDIHVEVLPGATAFVPALVVSGFPCDKFVFEGFLPQKKGRLKRLTLLSEESRTIVFYESPYRIQKLLGEFLIHFGEERQICIVRELTKKFEEIIRGSVTQCLEIIAAKPSIKGEFVVIVKGN